MDTPSFNRLGLAQPLLDALAEKSYSEPSPIQAAASPILLDGRDLLACAQTGTGKTASFALPALNATSRIGKKPRPGEIRTLILTPTRELAVQVADSFKGYGSKMPFRVGLVHGGVSQHPQVRALKRGVDVLVATPGRLLDLDEQGHVDYSKINMFVLDEADRMLDMGFVEDIRQIAQHIPEERQTVMFSATMAPAITKLAGTLLRDPEGIRIAPDLTTAERVEQQLFYVKPNDRTSLLLSLLDEREDDDGLSIIFSKTRHHAEKLGKFLYREGYEADSIHGGKSQNARQRILNRFKDGKTRILIATDVAARGIDVKNIKLVINFDLPMEAENYVHRIGRTARAGDSGLALSFCGGNDGGLLKDIHKFIKSDIPVNEEHEYHCGETADKVGRFLQRGKGGSGSGGRGRRGPRNRGRRPEGGYQKKRSFRRNKARSSHRSS